MYYPPVLKHLTHTVSLYPSGIFYIAVILPEICPIDNLSDVYGEEQPAVINSHFAKGPQVSIFGLSKYECYSYNLFLVDFYAYPIY